MNKVEVELRKFRTFGKNREEKIINLLDQEKIRWRNRPTRNLEIFEDGINYFENQGCSATEKNVSVLGFLKWLRNQEIRRLNAKPKKSHDRK